MELLNQLNFVVKKDCDWQKSFPAMTKMLHKTKFHTAIVNLSIKYRGSLQWQWLRGKNNKSVFLCC